MIESWWHHRQMVFRDCGRWIRGPVLTKVRFTGASGRIIHRVSCISCERPIWFDDSRAALTKRNPGWGRSGFCGLGQQAGQDRTGLAAVTDQGKVSRQRTIRCVRLFQAFVKRRLGAHEYPREVEFVSELPMTATGKIMRKELKKLEEVRKSKV